MKMNTRITWLAALLLFLPMAGSFASPAQTIAHRKVICIDPGHPSEVGRGTEGRHVTEMQVAWDVGCDLAKALRAQGYEVVLTKRSEGQFVKNRRRAEIANAAHADLMVRLHCDANSGTGMAVYAPDRQGTSGGVRGPSPQIIARSQVAARVFNAAAASVLGKELRDKGVFPDTSTAVGAKQGALTGSICSRVPVILIEMCVLTNPNDERFISSKRGHTLMVSALTAGIEAAVK
ncbi:MAG: N-acetylmuramoyl-L-alanine amidase [Capsulimonadaceae bacterium]|nr:N-acetylmuramoyl-L-alanine amidase [Capsulimonadaceae bacterium]